MKYRRKYMLKKVWFNEGWRRKYPSNSADLYVREIKLENLCGCTNPNIYEDYLEFCKEKHLKTMRRETFFSYLRNTYHTRTIIRKIDGKTYRILVV